MNGDHFFRLNFSEKQILDLAARFLIARSCLFTCKMHTNTRKLENSSLPRSHKVALQIVDLLRERGYHKEVSVEEVYKAIEEVRGSDPRTKRKWLKFMIDHGYLGWKTHRILEISPALLEAEKFFSNLKP